MGRLPMVPETAVPGAMQAVYHRVVQGETELATTLQALFASPWWPAGWSTWMTLVPPKLVYYYGMISRFHACSEAK